MQLSPLTQPSLAQLLVSTNDTGSSGGFCYNFDLGCKIIRKTDVTHVSKKINQIFSNTYVVIITNSAVLIYFIVIAAVQLAEEEMFQVSVCNYEWSGYSIWS